MEAKSLVTLNKEQQEACINTEGYIRVNAGPGTGKTKTLVHRYAFLIDELGISPSAILCITFTNKAALEMRSRIEKLCLNQFSPIVTTFHGFCNEFLRHEIDFLAFPQNFTLLDVEDAKEVLKEVYLFLNVDGKKYPLMDLYQFIDNRKGTIDYVKDIVSKTYEELINIAISLMEDEDVENAVFYAYLAYQKSHCYFDFADLLAFSVHILTYDKRAYEIWSQKFEYIMIDEFQDIDNLQNDLIEILSSYHHNLFVVGDPDQTIYSFRGAQVSYFKNFANVHQDCKKIFLINNYRTQVHILDCAYSLISHNEDDERVKLIANRKDITMDMMYGVEKLKEDADVNKLVSFDDVTLLNKKGLTSQSDTVSFFLKETQKKTMLPVVIEALSVDNESAYVLDGIKKIKALNKNASIAVLYRAHHVARHLERALILNGIAYKIVADVALLERKEIKDIISYIKLCLNVDDDLSFMRVVNEPKRGFGRSSLLKLKEYAKNEGTSLFVTLEQHLNDFRQKVKLQEFIKNVRDLNKPYFNNEGALKAIEYVSSRFSYINDLNKVGDTQRIDNINVLREIAKTYEEKESFNVKTADFIVHLALNAKNDYKDDNKAVNLMTVHNSKGLEFDYVFILRLNKGIFPSSKSNTTEQIAEERRLMYVAMTRARYQLIMLCAISEQDQKSMPSVFLSELLEDTIYRIKDSNNNRLSNAYVTESSAQFKVGDEVENFVLGKGKIIEIDLKNSSYKILFESLNKVRTVSFNAKLAKI